MIYYNQNMPSRCFRFFQNNAIFDFRYFSSSQIFALYRRNIYLCFMGIILSALEYCFYKFVVRSYS